jgi:diguanylate cyclase (GGDEF)-like protein
MRAFYDLAQREIERARRFKHPFTIAYMDLDNFKMINDQHGHSVGNELLRIVSETIKKNSRAVDSIARLGGDEFAVLLTETGGESAKVVFSKLHKQIMEVMDRNKWAVTLSIGAVTYITPPNTVDDMLKKADDLMYSVKKGGKNMIKYEAIY